MHPTRSRCGAVALGAVVAAVLVVTVQLEAIRVVPGLLLAFFLPGYAAAAALIRSERETSERITFSIGLSLAISVLVGIVLDRTTWHLTERSWALSLGGLTVLGCSLAAVTARPTVTAVASAPRYLPAGRVLAYTAVALLVGGAAAGAIALARQPADAARSDSYTVLWVAPGHPAGRFEVGVTSQELHAIRYRVLATAGNRLLFSREISLEPGQNWTLTGMLIKDLPAKVAVRLYRAGDPATPYRRVNLTLGGPLKS